jgi:hypothetical protein
MIKQTMRKHNRNHLLLIAVLLALVLGNLAFGLGASNTVPGARAGDGSNTISGYVVSNVDYVLAANPANIDRVTLSLDAAAVNVLVKVVAASATYTTCTNTAGFNWSCDLSPDVAVTSADQLSVIATE